MVDIKTILLIPEKTDIEFEDVFATWTGRGEEIRRLGKYVSHSQLIALRAYLTLFWTLYK